MDATGKQLKLKLTVGASVLTTEDDQVLREGVGQQQADVHGGAPLHCQRDHFKVSVTCFLYFATFL